MRATRHIGETQHALHVVGLLVDETRHNAVVARDKLACAVAVPDYARIGIGELARASQRHVAALGDH